MLFKHNIIFLVRGKLGNYLRMVGMCIDTTTNMSVSCMSVPTSMCSTSLVSVSGAAMHIHMRDCKS